MDKYTKALRMVFRVPLGIFYILLGILLIGISFWVSTFSDVASMLLLIAFCVSGFIINFGFGYAFLGDEYKTTNVVRDGHTIFAPVETKKFLKRRKFVTLIGFIAYILLAVYYIVRMILTSINTSKLLGVGFHISGGVLIVFAILSLVFAFCFFMVYKKTKHIDLNEK